MKEVIPGVFMMERLMGANVYLLLSNNGAVVVDSGVRSDADRILAQVLQAGHIPPIKSIVITHFHGDHAGGAAKLSRQWGAQVLAHKEDASYIIRPSSIPAFSNIKLFVNWFGANVALRSLPCKVDQALEDGDKVDALDGCVVIHTPGHTAGSLCLYQPERQVLFCGDALININPVTQKNGLGLYLRPITLDNAQALQSVRRLASLPIKSMCFGHGEPIVEAEVEQLNRFLANYEARP